MVTWTSLSGFAPRTYQLHGCSTSVTTDSGRSMERSVPVFVNCGRDNSHRDVKSIDKTVCDQELHGGHPVHAAHANLQLSHFIRNIAQDMVKKGFQVPTYVVHGPNEKSWERLLKKLDICTIKSENVIWESGYLANNIKHDISMHWFFPPMTCAGSQGVEVGISSSTGGTVMDPGDRWGCHTCCNRYYNTSTMEDLFTFTT